MSCLRASEMNAFHISAMSIRSSLHKNILCIFEVLIRAKALIPKFNNGSILFTLNKNVYPDDSRFII